MNRILPIIIILFLTTLITHAQRLHFSVGLEKTALKLLYGGGLTLETKSKWGVGVFYQTTLPNAPDENVSLRDGFYGVLFQVPLAKSEKINFFATARLGMVNENFFVVVPGLETRIKTWRKLSTVFNMGYRIGYPSIGIKLSHPIL